MANRVLCQNCNMFAAFCRFFRRLVPGFCAQWQNGKSRQQTSSVCCRLFGALAGTRIPDPLIKSQLLYRLSYKRIYCLQLINYTSRASFCQPLFSHFLRFAPGFPRAGKRQDGGRKFSPASAAKIWNCAGRAWYNTVLAVPGTAKVSKDSGRGACSGWKALCARQYRITI